MLKYLKAVANMAELKICNIKSTKNVWFKKATAETKILKKF